MPVFVFKDDIDVYFGDLRQPPRTYVSQLGPDCQTLPTRLYKTSKTAKFLISKIPVEETAHSEGHNSKHTVKIMQQRGMEGVQIFVIENFQRT